MISELKAIECLTLFVEDLALVRKFYEAIFAAKPVFEDSNCTVLRFENLMLNLLKVSESPTLIAPAKVAGPAAGARFLLTIRVRDVDDVCRQLQKHDVKILNGPLDRPWGRRTAAFCDPAGHAWEVAQEI